MPDSQLVIETLRAISRPSAVRLTSIALLLAAAPWIPEMVTFWSVTWPPAM
jgi:hypothetical protein